MGGTGRGASDWRAIADRLRALDTRLRWQQSAIWLPRGLAAGLAAALLLALAARLWPLLERAALLRLSGLLAVIGAAATLLVVWLWRRLPLELARRYDRLFGLKERLSTAVELAGDDPPPGVPAALIAAQRADAARAAAGIDIRRGMPLRSDWRGWALAGLALGLLAAALLIPNPQEAALAEQAAVEEAIAEQVEALEALRAEALESPTLADEERAAVVEALDAAIETLEQRGVTQEEALAALDATAQTLRDLSEAFAEQRRQVLEEAGSAFEQAGLEGVAEALAEGDLAAAAEQLQGLLDGLTPEEMAEMAERLEALAESLAGTDPALAEALREAAEALREGDAEAAAEALERAAGELAEAGQPSVAEVDEFAGAVEEGSGKVAGAKQPGTQPGQGGMGQAPPGQPQPGQGGQGEGEGGPGEGPDPGQVAGETPRGGGDPDGGERPLDNVYAPQRIGGEGGETVDIPGTPAPGAPVQEGELAENPTGAASVPYTQVWADYSGAVNEALESGYIPLGMRGLIRGYFSRLDPAN